MSVWTVFALALALSMDALAVSLAVGVSLGRVSRRQTFRLAFHFGLFQALMPVLGWAAGLSLVGLMAAFDHWVAFALLALVGGKMVKEALWPDAEKKSDTDPTQGVSLLLLSVATSLDALAVGLTLSLLDVAVWWPALTIGLVCAAITAAGLHAGGLAARLPRFQRWAELAGGLVLIAIGAKILWDHLGT